MIQIGRDQKLDGLQRVIDGIAIVEQRANIKVRDHLAFGNDSNANIQCFKDKEGASCIGEKNENNNLHGRGIAIYSFGYISIRYYNNGLCAPGNYITISSGGMFRVGEWYEKDGKKW